MEVADGPPAAAASVSAASFLSVDDDDAVMAPSLTLTLAADRS